MLCDVITNASKDRASNGPQSSITKDYALGFLFLSHSANRLTYGSVGIDCFERQLKCTRLNISKLTKAGNEEFYP